MARAADTDFYDETMRGVDLSPALVLPPTTEVGDAIRQMQHKRCGCAVVVDDKGVRGTFTERTVINRILAEGVKMSAEIGPYVNSDAPTVGLDESVASAIRKMHEKNVRHVPVWDGKAVLGILSVRDVIAIVAQYNPSEIYNLPPRVRQKMRSVDGA